MPLITGDDKAIAPPPPPVTPACQHMHLVGDATLACSPSLDMHFTKDDWFAMIQWAGKCQPPLDLVADVMMMMMNQIYIPCEACDLH